MSLYPRTIWCPPFIQPLSSCYSCLIRQSHKHHTAENNHGIFGEHFHLRPDCYYHTTVKQSRCWESTCLCVRCVRCKMGYLCAVDTSMMWMVIRNILMIKYMWITNIVITIVVSLSCWWCLMLRRFEKTIGHYNGIFVIWGLIFSNKTYRL